MKASDKKRNRVVSTEASSSKKPRQGQQTIHTFFPASQESTSSQEPSGGEIPWDENLSNDYIERDFELAKELALENLAESKPKDTEKLKSWSTLFAPVQPPKCVVHQEPCKELTTTKQGPNKGKNFWICSR